MNTRLTPHARWLAAVTLAAALALLALPVVDARAALADRVNSLDPGDASARDSAVSIETAAGGGVRLQRQASSLFTSPGLDPRCLQVLENGNVLFAWRGAGVWEVDPGGNVVWEFDEQDARDAKLVTGEPANLPTADNGMWVFSARRLSTGFGGAQDTTLIVDRQSKLVFEVDRQKRIVWRYAGSGATALKDAFFATRPDGGNTPTLVLDNKESGVLAEVRTTDYDASAPDYGFTPSSVTWSYGASGLLQKPKYAERIDGGAYLIVDEDAETVIEVTRDKKVTLLLSAEDVPAELRPKFCPSYAHRLADGTTLVTDVDNSRIHRIDRSRHILETWGGGADGIGFNLPRAAVEARGGGILVADEKNRRVVRVAYPTSGQLVSRPDDLGLPAVTKSFGTLGWDADAPAGTTLGIEYSIDGGPWKSAGSSGRYTFPSGTSGRLFRYRVTHSSTNGWLTPTLRALSVTTAVASGQGGGGPSGSGSGGTGQAGKAGGTASGAKAPAAGRPPTLPRVPAVSGGGAANGSGPAFALGSDREATDVAGAMHTGWLLEDIAGRGDGSGTGSGAGSGRPLREGLPGLALLGGLYLSGAAFAARTRIGAD